MKFLGDILNGLLVKLGDPDWWAGELPSWLVFSVIIGSAVKLVEVQRYKREREPYERWTLRVIGYNDPPQGLDPDEVRRFLTSSFEFWKFVKSAASGTHELSLRSCDAAIDNWVMVDPTIRRITVNLAGIVPAGHGKLKNNVEAPKVSADAAQAKANFA